MKASCAPLHGQQTIFLTRDKMNRDVSEVDIVFKQVKNSPATCVRQFYIKRYRNWVVFISEIKHIAKAGCYHYFQIILVCFVNHDLSKTKVVFYYQYYFVVAH